MEPAGAAESRQVTNNEERPIRSRKRLSDSQANIQERREQVYLLLLKNLTQKDIAAALNESSRSHTFLKRCRLGRFLLVGRY